MEERNSIQRDRVSYSPDRQWFIGKVGEENFIMDQQGRPVQQILGEWGKWAPDSSTLIQFVEIPELQETQFLVYSRESGWQNTLTRHLTEGYLWWGMWINPTNGSN